MVVEKIQDLYPNENIDKINIYINIGVNLIREYLNVNDSNEEIEFKYENALLLFLINSIEYSSDKGILSKKQGNKSVTYANYRKALTLNSDVKALLPCTKLNIMG